MKPGTRQPVVFQPHVSDRFGRGVDQIVAAVRPTLGPLPRTVAISSAFTATPPELPDSAATIVRRIVEVADPDEDMGAMFVRHMIWRVHEEAGDGAATAAVLFHAVYRQGARYIAAGGNAQLLRRSLERGIHAILEQLACLTVPQAGQQELSGIAETLCHEPQLARLLSEIFDVIGADGRLEIRSGRRREHTHEYVEGVYWHGSGVASPHMLTDQIRERTDFDDAALVISDLEVTESRDLLHPITFAHRAGLRSLVIMARSFPHDVSAWTLAASKEPDRLRVIAVQAPGMVTSDQATALDDLAVLTGGRPLLRAAGETLRGVTVDDFGYARRIWADREHLGIIRGQGDARRLRAHVATLHAAFQHAQDADTRKRIERRLGQCIGGSATLYIGGLSEGEINQQKDLAQRTAEALRGVLRAGVVPGGGTALLRCRPALQRLLDQTNDEAEGMAYHMLITALEAPFRTILANAGYDPGRVLAAVSEASEDAVFDVRSGQQVALKMSGIWDVASAQATAVRHGLGGAALALTIDVLVHSKQPVQSVTP